MFDISIMGVVLYLFYPIFIISLSIIVSFTKETSLQSYFFANYNTHWSLIGISILASAFFSPYIFIFFSKNPQYNIPIIFGIISSIILFVLSKWVSNKTFDVATLPEYFGKRFNIKVKNFITILYLISNVFLRLGIILIAGNFFINEITGINAYFSLIFFLVVTGIYLIIGGMTAEIYVSITQILVIAIVAIIFIVWFFSQSETNLKSNSIITSTNVSQNFFNSQFTISELIFTFPILGLWFWWADQMVIQKVKSLNNNFAVKKSLKFAACMQIIPIIIFTIPVVITGSMLGGNTTGQSIEAIFAGNIIPQSLRGGVVLAIAAGLITSFAGVFKSSASIVSFDIYKNIKPNASDRELVLIGRLTIMALLFITILSIPLIQSFDLSLCFKFYESFVFIISMILSVLVTSLVSKSISSIAILSALSLSSMLILIRTISSLTGNSSQIDGFFNHYFLGSDFLEFSTFIFLFTIGTSLLCYKIMQFQLRSKKGIESKVVNTTKNNFKN